MKNPKEKRKGHLGAPWPNLGRIPYLGESISEAPHRNGRGPCYLNIPIGILYDDMRFPRERRNTVLRAFCPCTYT